MSCRLYECALIWIVFGAPPPNERGGREGVVTIGIYEKNFKNREASWGEHHCIIVWVARYRSLHHTRDIIERNN